MKTEKILLSLSFLLFTLNCKPARNVVQRIVEDGVEVILNSYEPYKIEGQLNNLILERLFIIDFESDDIAKIGIKDVSGFDVDSAGNIYGWSHAGSENFIFKFSGNGKYVSSFGRAGQGPGELGAPVHLRINDRDEIIIAETLRRRLIIMNTDGKFIEEIPISSPAGVPATLLGNKKILAPKTMPLNEDGMSQEPIIIWSANFKPLVILHLGEKYPNWMRAKRINGLRTAYPHFPPWYVSKGSIYLGNKNNGYEILVYDFDGKLQKKVRKKYFPVPVAVSVKEQVLKLFDNPRFKELNIKDKVYFPDHMPPFQYFFVDERGRLFVMTNEKEEGERGYKYDIFNHDGVFVGRTSLDNFDSSQAIPLEGKAKQDRLYHLRVKDSGYQELVVYRIKWTE